MRGWKRGLPASRINRQTWGHRFNPLIFPGRPASGGAAAEACAGPARGEVGTDGRGAGVEVLEQHRHRDRFADGPAVIVQGGRRQGYRLVQLATLLAQHAPVVPGPLRHDGGEGREEYLTKRQRILLSTANLVEIDLLRQGARVPMQKPLPPAAYYVLVCRTLRRPFTDVWPILVREPLPTVLLPLLPGDSDVPLDLQLALSTVYDVCGYDLLIDYSQPPEVPLPPEDTAWAAERVRAFRGSAEGS